MARQVGTQFIGTVGNLVYYKMNDEYFTRIKGRCGKQAPVAKKQAAVLGQASALGARIRKAFSLVVRTPVNRKLMYSFNKVLQQWLHTGQAAGDEVLNDIPYIRGFSFYGKGAEDFFRVALPVNRTADGHIALQIPPFDSPNPIHPLPFNGKVLLQVCAASCKLNDRTDTSTWQTELDIRYNGTPIPAQQLSIPLQTGAGRLVVVVVAVNRRVAGVVGVMYN